MSHETAVSFPGDKVRPKSTEKKARKLKVPESYTAAIFGGRNAQRIRTPDYVKPLHLPGVRRESAAAEPQQGDRGSCASGSTRFEWWSMAIPSIF